MRHQKLNLKEMKDYQSEARQYLAEKPAVKTMLVISLVLLAYVLGVILFTRDVQMKSHWIVATGILIEYGLFVTITMGTNIIDYRSTQDPLKKEELQATADYLQKMDEIKQAQQREKSSQAMEAIGL